MINRISRRDFGRLAAAGAAVGAFGGLTGPAAAETRLRLIWWGNPDRDERTLKVVDLYKAKNQTSPSIRKPTPGTTTGRSSPRRPPGRTCPT